MASRKAHPKVVTSDYNPGLVADNTLFWAVWREHEQFLLGLCRKWTGGDEGEAREMLHGGMLRAFERTGGSMEDIGNPRAWLAKVIKSYVVDTFRKRQRLPQYLVDPDFLIEVLDRDRPQLENSPDRSILRDESYLMLKAAIENLPDRLRSAMILRAYQEMPYKDIGEHLQITTDTARKRVQEARAILRIRIAGAEDSPRPNRRPHPGGSSPRSERRAADDILHSQQLNEEPTRFAHPVQIDLGAQGSIEWPVFRSRKPVRIAQRLQTIRKYLDKHPTGWTRRREYAMLLEVQGNWLEAIREGLLTLSQQPHLVRFRIDVVRWMTVVGQKEEAIQLLKQGLQHTKHPIYYARLQARLLFLQGRYDDAIQLTGFRAADNTASPFPIFFEALYQASFKDASWRPALMNLPAEREAGFWLAAYKRLQVQRGKPVATEIPAAAMGEDAYALHRQLETDLLAGRMGMAKEKGRLIKRLAPRSVLYRRSKICLLLESGKTERVREEVEELMAKQSGDAMALHTAAAALERIGAGEDAGRIWKMLDARFPKEALWRSILPLYGELPSR